MVREDISDYTTKLEEGMGEAKFPREYIEARRGLPSSLSPPYAVGVNAILWRNNQVGCFRVMRWY